MNSKGHFIISVFKSVIRIASCIAAVVANSLYPLAIGFISAELCGILEELVDSR